MNTKIYFNDKYLEFEHSPSQDSENQLIRFDEEIDEKKLKIILDELLSENTFGKSKNRYSINEKHSDFVLAFLKKNLYFIEAAGGLIKKKKEYLFIFRLGRWDLPKGKLDKGETIEHAAIRECEEECAIKKLKIQSPLSPTYHVYKYKNSYALKQTHWFYMTTDFDGELKPQTEENISEVKWFTKDKVNEVVFKNSYYTIKDVINEAFKEREI